METNQIERLGLVHLELLTCYKSYLSQTPILEDIRDVSIAQTMRNGLSALISYENKVFYQASLIDSRL